MSKPKGSKKSSTSTPKDNSAIYRQISQLNGKINDLETARSEVSAARKSCRNSEDDWRDNYDKLAEKREVQKTDVFEGDMAQNLDRYVSDIITEIGSGVNATIGITGALDYLITEIDNKITEMQNSIHRLSNQL